MLKITKNDEDKETAGIWEEYYGVELLIARFKNERFLRKLKHLNKRKRKNLDLSDPQTEQTLIKIIADDVLLDWRNFASDGETINYTVERGIELLTNDRDCLDFISDISMDLENFLADEVEAIVGE